MHKNILMTVLLTVSAANLVADGSTDPLPRVIKAVKKSRTQERLECLLPERVAKLIAEKCDYPYTLAAIAHVESGGNQRAVGSSGSDKGLFQIMEKYHGPVDLNSIESQVEQANRLFLKLVKRYGYRQAVARWNGSPKNPKVKRYQRIVLAKVGRLRSDYPMRSLKDPGTADSGTRKGVVAVTRGSYASGLNAATNRLAAAADVGMHRSKNLACFSRYTDNQAEGSTGKVYLISEADLASQLVQDYTTKNRP